jgi:hypothetical protein
MGCSCSLFAGGLDGVAGHAQLAHGGAQGTGADDLSAFSLNMGWHPRTHSDPAQRWLREQVAAVVTPGP